MTSQKQMPIIAINPFEEKNISTFFSLTAYSQCPRAYINACTSDAPTVIGTSISCTTPGIIGGRWNFRVNHMLAGVTYRISNCGSGLNTQMTIRDSGHNAVAFNDDNGPDCTGTEASIDFTPTFTGDYRIQLNRFDSDLSGASNGVITVTILHHNNNDCSNAIGLTINTSCSFTTYTNEFATDSGETPAPACSSYSGGDVWFSVTVPANGNLEINTNTGVVIDGGMVVYSGSCGTLSLISCDDNSSTNGNMPYISLTGQTPGDTLFIRFFEYGNNNNGTFDICITNPSCVTKNWIGITSTDWDTPSNWSPTGVPTDVNCVVISNSSPYTTIISGTNHDAYAQNLTITATGNLELQSSNNLTITAHVQVDTNGTFNIRDSASLLQIIIIPL